MTALYPHVRCLPACLLFLQNFPEGEPRKVTITGKADSVARAAAMVEELIRGEPGSASAVVQKVGRQSQG